MFTEDGILIVLMLFVCCTAGNDDIGDEGAIRIAEGLEKNTFVKVLGLGCVFPPPSFFIHCLSFFHLLRASVLMRRMNILYLTFMSSIWNE